jgi:outer membrane protein assembly factor BamE
MNTTMRKTTLLFLSFLMLALASGCVYRAAVSQGNLIKQEDLDQTEIGMTKSQVRFLLGTPMIDDPFTRNRWDYVYYLKVGRKDAGQKRWVSIYFIDEEVTEIRSDQDLSSDL